MDKNIKLAIDITGILISISGIVVFFKNQNTAIAVTLSIVSVLLIVYAINLYLLPNIKTVNLKWDLTIKDNGGKSVEGKKTSIIKANKRNIKSLVDRNFTTSGRYEFIDCNLGDLHGPIDEGGSKMITTLLKAELPVNREIEKVLRFKVFDTFTESKESLTSLIEQTTDNLEIRIGFPENRKVISARAFRYIADQAVELNTLSISTDRREVSFFHRKPKIGDKYVLEWEW